jgi:hypothetical protein
VNPLLAGLATLGDTWDRAASTTRQTTRYVRAALASRLARRAGMITAIVVLVLYLLAIGDIAISASGRWATAPLLQTAPENVLHARAPYLFEPVLALHPSAHLAVFVSPLNLLLGALVAALAGCNLAVASYSAQRAACRRRGYGRLLGALPAFLLGFACCTPTVLLALGASTGAAILPVLLPLRPIFYPLTLLLLVTGLVWGTHRANHQHKDPLARPAVVGPTD